jgi:hypothetical protein
MEESNNYISYYTLLSNLLAFHNYNHVKLILSIFKLVTLLKPRKEYLWILMTMAIGVSSFLFAAVFSSRLFWLMSTSRNFAHSMSSRLWESGKSAIA